MIHIFCSILPDPNYLASLAGGPAFAGGQVAAETRLKVLCKGNCGGVVAKSRNQSSPKFQQLPAPKHFTKQKSRTLTLASAALSKNMRKILLQMHSLFLRQQLVHCFFIHFIRHATIHWANRSALWLFVKTLALRAFVGGDVISVFGNRAHFLSCFNGCTIH
jgi:hypothetical protein